MSDYKILLPVRDEDELVDFKAISQLPTLLDRPDADITRELLLLSERAALPGRCSIGQLHEVIESMDATERRLLLDACRVGAGYKTIRAEKEAATLEYARTHPDYRDHEPVLLPSGAIGSRTDIEDEAAREQARAASLAARRRVELEERAIEAEAIAANRAAVDAEIESKLPRSFRGLPPA